MHMYNLSIGTHSCMDVDVWTWTWTWSHGVMDTRTWTCGHMHMVNGSCYIGTAVVDLYYVSAVSFDNDMNLE